MQEICCRRVKILGVSRTNIMLADFDHCLATTSNINVILPCDTPLMLL